MMNTAIIFPGQGSQSIGMGSDLYNNFKTARDVFAQACDLLHFDLKKLCFEGPQDVLDSTFNAQSALLTVSIAAYKVLLEEAGTKAGFIAGHSLGEYSSLTAAESISFDSALPLVRFRGKAMSEAAVKNPGIMAAILGLSREEVEDAVHEAKAFGVICAANYNSPGQIVISGGKEAVEKCMELCKKKGAKRAIPLAVSGPFHSELMESAAKELSGYLQKITFKEPKCPVFSNVTAKPYEKAQDVPALLVKQIKSPVMWEDTVMEMEKDGAEVFIEVGSGKVLTGLVKRIAKEAVCCNVEDTQSLKNTIMMLNQARKI